jgi:multiple sugar transport system substrate-binding protein
MLALALGLALGWGCDSSKSEPAAKPPPKEGEKEKAPKAGGGEKAPAGEAQDKDALVIWWAQWPPADGLQKLGNEYAQQSGQKVTVYQIPWGDYQTKVFNDFGKAKTSFDIVVGDSQWIGQGAEGGLYLDLSDWLKKTIDIKSIHEKAGQYLCQSPPGSGKWFAAPCETDAMGYAYRKDWFENPQEKEAFKGKFNRELKVPDTWEELKQVAEFFTRPDKKIYGLANVTGRMYDDPVMGFEQILYSFGGSWGDPKTFKVKGLLDGKPAIDALTFYKEVSTKFAPPGGNSLNYFQALDLFKAGTVAMLMDYFAFFPDLLKPEVLGDKVGFFVMPKKGDKRVASLGGQGMSISKKTTPAKQEAAKKFIAWFLKTEQQKKWVAIPSCFTADANLLKSEEFRKATPFNAPFADSVDILQDFWNVPFYADLLNSAVKLIGEALDGVKAPEEALKALAEEHEKIFKREGYLK